MSAIAPERSSKNKNRTCNRGSFVFLLFFRALTRQLYLFRIFVEWVEGRRRHRHATETERKVLQPSFQELLCWLNLGIAEQQALLAGFEGLPKWNLPRVQKKLSLFPCLIRQTICRKGNVSVATDSSLFCPVARSCQLWFECLALSKWHVFSPRATCKISMGPNPMTYKLQFALLQRIQISRCHSPEEIGDGWREN